MWLVPTYRVLAAVTLTVVVGERRTTFCTTSGALTGAVTTVRAADSLSTGASGMTFSASARPEAGAVEAVPRATVAKAGIRRLLVVGAVALVAPAVASITMAAR